MNNKLYLCIHGHFYQPPRENAWTGEIEPQASAAPFHDWNERIYQECYKPNTKAVIVNDHGHVVKRINNYEHMNFDIGSTLFAWMKRNHPKTYSRIIDADKESVKNHNGHGNAIAMVYSHIIMPLANEKDKETQIKWGMKDFEYHFGRSSEAIWLSETACNFATIEALIKENIRYIILDPSQAAEVKAPGEKEWDDLSKGGFNTKQAYRCYSKIDPAKYINIFFYDGPLAKAIAFEDILFDSHRLIERIKASVDPSNNEPQLISAATDGETFGHHKAYSERTLAYLFDELIEKTGFKLVNYAEYLELHPAEWEVRIKEGINGEGTSWSCPHGLGRWQEDCGCHTGGNDGWNQEWRKPLRESLNWLRDELIKIYETHASEYLKDIWAARNDYINVILDTSFRSVEKFFYFNSKRYLTREETEKCLDLLEMQKFSMLMFTSCGWFFSEISGIETKQILEYAARAIELAKEISGEDLNKDLIKMLSEAKSNKPEFVNGGEIYKKLAGYVEDKIIANDITINN